MMKRLSGLLLMLLTLNAIAQEEGTGIDPAKFLETIESTTKVAGLNSAKKQNNEFSVRPIRDEDVMFSIRLWSKMNFNEKQNSNWNAKESRITKIIIEGIREYYKAQNEALDQVVGITPYQTLENEVKTFTEDDILLEEDFNTNLSDFSTQQGNYDETQRPRARTALKIRDGGIYANYSNARLDSIIDAEYAATSGAKALDPAIKGDLDVLLLEEDLLFDRNQSLAKWDIVSVTLIAPPKSSVDGAEREIVRVKYQELVAYIAKIYGESNKDRAYWYNDRNPRNKELSFAHAFDLRLFSTYITKFQNIGDDNIQTLYGKQNYDYSIIEQAMKKRFELLEKMHNLWEY
ncbi:hypothetical protein BFP97_14130 [Roseivirga sp. 4D4]|uniref:hypothetical protein n=1 Tax=Roseivirga sp. 4D4 TaxID=1889784 RepID=UPI000852F641|nr:hypothetical protein [Roseivirga sp. 4D4]OEK02590.1 hypothetical protein BFP97_14130 [Roseivirga sp. 4D4]